MTWLRTSSNNWRGVWNKALSDFWCNVKFSSSFTTEYKEIWNENLVIYQKSLKAFLQAPLQLLKWSIMLMPTSGDLKSGDFCFITPRYQTTPPHTPQKKGDDTSSPSTRPPCSQIDLELLMFTLPLQREKRKKISNHKTTCWRKLNKRFLCIHSHITDCLIGSPPIN